jgi:RNA polymerase sigma factor (sigma-70 family)
LLRFALRLTRGRLDAARDLVQDTFLRLWELDPATASVVRGHLAEWLHTVCRHRAIDIGRKERRMHLAEPQEMEQVGRSPTGNPERSSSPSGAGEEREAVSCMFDAMESLPERQQEILRLKFQAGLSYQEIARVMELSVGNVGFIIHNALKSLRVKLLAVEGRAGHADPLPVGEGRVREN